MTSAESYGWLASFFTTIIFVPQLIKAITTRMTKDISLWTLILSIAGNGFWFAHARLTANLPLLVCTSLIIVISISLILFKELNERAQ